MFQVTGLDISHNGRHVHFKIAVGGQIADQWVVILTCGEKDLDTATVFVI
jgi:hypothetical protein